VAPGPAAKDPALAGTQDVWPIDGWKVPAAQGVWAAEPVPETKFPALAGRHEDWPVCG